MLNQTLQNLLLSVDLLNENKYFIEFIENILFLINEQKNEYIENIDLLITDIEELYCIQFEYLFDLNKNNKKIINNFIEIVYNISLYNSVEEQINFISNITEKDDSNFDELNLMEEKLNIPQSIQIISNITEKDDSNFDELNLMEEKLEKLKNIPQPIQRTPDWYKFRHNLITASNAYKAFESEKVKNQLIYEKCKPVEIYCRETTESKTDDNNDKQNHINTDSPLHWGQKYEPISVMYYNYTYKTTVSDFGCIQHPKYSFLGASPDGINIDKNSHLFGRMLEIKNIVNRPITGIPKKEYWVQMQLQMEVCDLDLCDFLETKFIEYSSYQEFIDDTENKDINIESNKTNICISKDNKLKGIIIYFQNNNNSSPVYIYKPLDLTDKDEINIWEEEQLNIYENTPYYYTFVKYIYWKLEIISCVLVSRDKKWFNEKISQLENIWRIIEKERITGYEHRAPTKRVSKKKENIIDITPILYYTNIVKL